MIIRPSKHILLIVLLFSILFTSLVITHAQNPTPTSSPREQLIRKIQVDAKRHVEINEGMKTESVVNRYRNNNVGLTPEQIAYVYEKAYAWFKKAQKPDPWENFRPQTGWIIAAILFVLLILRDVLKKWITNFFEMVGNWIYTRLSGSRLLRGTALHRYRGALIDKYDKLRIPFRPQDRPLMMRDVYVPLKVAGAIDLDQIDAYNAVSEYQKLMIVGAPGSGKSMLCKNIAFAYAEGRLQLPDRSIPILLELHRLNNLDFSIEQHLIAELARNDFPHAEQFVFQSLKKGTLMLLMDGLDEVSSNERGRVVQAIKDLLDRYRKCRVLITCRTAVYRDEFRDTAEQKLEIIEFSDQQIRRFLHSWEPDMPADKSIEQLMHTLRDRPRIIALARNPLLLTIIAYLYTDTPYVLPHSRAEFYKESSDVLLRHWHSERNRFEARDKRAILQHLALFNQDTAIRRQGDRRSIEYKEVVEQVRQVLPSVNLRDEQVDDILKEIVERSGLLLSIDGGERYQFVHLTLQEFFAAEELTDNTEGLISRFLADCDTWRETIKLWCGLASDSTVLVQEIYKEDPITAFECLADAKKIDPVIADEILNSFKTRLDADDDEIDSIVRAFGVVASDLRPRGKSVFEFLEQTLQTPTRQEQFLAAAIALSFTNLPRAAEVLGKYFTSQSEIREALIRMGDIAVPVLLFSARKGSSDALDDLQAIGTPEVAEALVPLLWDRKDIVYGVAWRLAALLNQPNVENVLRNYSLTEDQRKAEWVDWIWRPFNEPENSALPIIAGRVAFLIERSFRTAPKESSTLDPRLSIPLYSVGTKNEALKQYLLDTVPTTQRVKLLQRMSKTRRAITQNDWINLSRPVEYDFNRGWHYRVVLIVAFIISIIGLSLAVFTIGRSQVLFIWTNVLTFIMAVSIISGWLYLWNKNWDSKEFVLYLFLGIVHLPFISFALSIVVFGTNILWSGIVGIIFFSWFFVPIGVLVGLMTTISINVGMLCGMIVSAIAGVLSGILSNLDFFDFYRDIVDTYREDSGVITKKILLGGWLGLPLANYFTTKLMIGFLPVWTVVLIWTCLLGICALLWWRGRWRHRAAQNPLSGILEL